MATVNLSRNIRVPFQRAREGLLNAVLLVFIRLPRAKISAAEHQPNLGSEKTSGNHPYRKYRQLYRSETT